MDSNSEKRVSVRSQLAFGLLPEAASLLQPGLSNAKHGKQINTVLKRIYSTQYVSIKLNDNHTKTILFVDEMPDRVPVVSRYSAAPGEMPLMRRFFTGSGGGLWNGSMSGTLPVRTARR